VVIFFSFGAITPKCEIARFFIAAMIGAPSASEKFYSLV